MNKTADLNAPLLGGGTQGFDARGVAPADHGRGHYQGLPNEEHGGILKEG